MKINKYPDGTSYVRLDASLDNTSSCIIWKLNSYKDLWHLNQFVDAHNSRFRNTPRILIPNLIDAQADKRFNIGESSGLKLVCNFLNRMNADFKIFHPHNPEVVEALIDRVEIIDNHGFICRVLEQLDCEKYTHKIKRFENDNLILMSSDAGGFKPLMKLCDKINWKGETYSASKARTESGMKQLVDRENFEGKDILIVDDICVYGGTFKGLSKLLKERNCGKLYLAVSHMTMQDLGEDCLTGYYDKVFTTNSKFNKYYVNYPNLEIIKLF